MKKHQKILMLSVLVISSVQGGVVEASEVFLDTKEERVQVTSSPEKSDTLENSGFNTNASEIADNQVLPPESSTEDSGSEDKSSSGLDNETEKSGSGEIIGNEKVIEEGTAEKPKKTDASEEASRESTFQENLSRKNLPKVPVRLKPLPVKNSGSPFRDTSRSIFKNHINWIYSRGITTGYTPTTYNPEAKVTRGEMAAFLYRFYNVTVNNQKLPPAPQPYANQPVYYSQLDSRWRNIRLNASNVGVSGCVPTSLAMILRGSYGMNVDPGIVAKKADTISRESFGLSGRDLINTAKSYGRNVEVIHNKERAASLLKVGYPLVFYINVGIGHAVVVSDYNNGLVNVNDPYGKLFYPTGKTSLNELWGRPSQDAMDWNAGRPVFAVK